MTDEAGHLQKTNHLDSLILFICAVAVNTFIAVVIDEPGYIDAAYYFNGARFISQGVWEEPYFWNYVTVPASLPAPIFSYWQPLPSLIGALGIILLPFLRTFDAAQAPFVLLGSLIPVMTYHIARPFGKRRHGLLAGFLMIFSGYTIVYWSLPETFTPFTLSVGMAFIMIGKARGSVDERPRLRFLFAGLFAGLAHLSRADGSLVLLVILGLAVLWRDERSFKDSVFDALTALAAYLLVMSPLFFRNYLVFGSIQAPGGFNAAYLIDYNDLYRYPSDLSFSTMMAGGIEPLLVSKWEVFITNGKVFIGVLSMTMLSPFMLIGLWKRFRKEPFFGLSLYSLGLFLAMTLVFSQAGAHGSWLHSAASLMPFIMSLAILGLGDAIDWVASKLPHWKPELAHRNFGIFIVIVAAGISGFIGSTRILGTESRSWNEYGNRHIGIGEMIESLDGGGGARVMVADPPGLYAYTALSAIPLVAGDEANIVFVMREFGANYIALWDNVPTEILDLKTNGPSGGELVLVGEGDGFTLYHLPGEGDIDG